MLVKNTNNTKNIWLLIPLFGTLFFVCLYIIATQNYPGGSQVNRNSKGFSWLNNYWCNLLNENAMNGYPNSARPLAVAAMIVLCLTLANFWYIFPQQVAFKKKSRLVIQFSGVIAMTVAMLLFTDLHDIVVNVASFFGLIATIATFVGLRKLKWTRLFWLGMFNLILVALNNILYYGNDLKLYLPVVQKITFLFFLLWICLIDVKIYRKKIQNSLK